MEPLASTSVSTEGKRSGSLAFGLLQRWAKGDEAAFASLVHEHQDISYRYARRICGDQDLARDIVQEAFMRVMRHHERFSADQSFRAWLLHIIRNLAIDALRRQKTRSAVPYEDHLRLCSRLEPSERMERNETSRRIAETLLEIPEKYREILVMREMDGVAAEEIAAIIGVDYGTTRWRLHKARNLFRSAWVRRYGEAMP